MRIVNITYLKEVHSLLVEHQLSLSNKRLRRLAYLDVHQNNYTSFELYNAFKKIVNRDAANNQLIVLMIVIGLLVASGLFFLL